MSFPVIKGVAYCLAHAPSLVRYGSKTSREIAKDQAVLGKILERLRSYQAAVAYPPHQVYVGNLRPDDLRRLPRPWYNNPVPEAGRFGPYGEIMPEAEFYGLMKIADEFNLVFLEEGFTAQVKEALARHPLIGEQDLRRLGVGVAQSKIEEKLATGWAVPLYVEKEQLVGCLERGHDEDESLTAPILLENLACKASAILVVRYLLQDGGADHAAEVGYILNCGEEAVGDRYQRGGGNLAKAVGEFAGCRNATGADVKAFCCAPIHSLVLAAGLVQAGIFDNVVVFGGGSLAKLGMKLRGYLAHPMPILEDVLASLAVLVGRDDGRSPFIRLDAVGKHDIGAGSSPQAIYESLVVRPLEKLGLGILDVDKYAVEMHNPEITEPAGSGNVPHLNYRMIGALAAFRQEMDVAALDQFVETHGMVGFSPTQGHIPAAVPFMGHARDMIMRGELSNVMFVAKGSLFLSKMTQLSDGMSFIIEHNPGSKSNDH